MLSFALLFVVCCRSGGSGHIHWHGAAAEWGEWLSGGAWHSTYSWLLSLSLLKQDRRLKMRGQLRDCRKGVFLVQIPILAINLSPNKFTVKLWGDQSQTSKHKATTKAKLRRKNKKKKQLRKEAAKTGKVREWSCRVCMYISSKVLQELAAAL